MTPPGTDVPERYIFMRIMYTTLLFMVRSYLAAAAGACPRPTKEWYVNL